MIQRAVVVMWLLLCPVLSLGGEKSEPANPELNAIATRGRMLAEYDVAGWHATDAVEALNPDKSVAPLYIARKTGGAWEVAFGRWNEKRDKFLIVYLASQAASPEEFKVKKFEPPQEDQGFYLHAARAMETATLDFGTPRRIYNRYVLPTDHGRLYVYFLPAQTEDGVYPLGADVRYLLSEDGATIVDKHPMHQTLLESNAGNPSKDAKKMESGYHAHVLSNLPEDSDVFYVLSRKPLMPEYIGTPDKHVYVVTLDGSIKQVK